MAVADVTVWQTLGAIGGVLGLGALVAWYFREFLLAYLPGLHPARAGRKAQQRDLPLPKGDRFVVLIADLQGDDDQKAHTRHVARALDPYAGLDLVRIGPGPEWDVGSRDDWEVEARALLANRRGDVLISGDVATKDKGLRLRILPADPAVRADRPAPEGRRSGEYTLTETGLPLDFDRDFESVLVALVLGAAAPATQQQGLYLVDVLEPVATRLKRLCAHLPARLDPDQRGGIWHALGLAASTLGDQKGENAWLEEAVVAHRAALEVLTRERVPLDWAMTQNNLGIALKDLGGRSEGEAGRRYLEGAVAACRAALEVRTREALPQGWAMTQNNLGNLLVALSSTVSTDDAVTLLAEAARGFRNVLELYPDDLGTLRKALMIWHDRLYDFTAARECGEFWYARHQGEAWSTALVARAL
jgi:tetratricopeptide (TPR) repeat protein